MDREPSRRRPPARLAVAAMVAAAALVTACAARTGQHGAPPVATAGSAIVDVASAGAGELSREPRPPSASSAALPSLTIVTGPERETDFRTGLDLARFVAMPAGLDLDVRPSKGTTDNLHRLRDDPKIDLAIVQYDVLKAFVDEAKRGNGAAAKVVAPVRVVAPLYTQEIYFIVRRDSDLRSIDQIRERRINVGVLGSGSALTVAAVYRQLFGTSIAAGRASYLDDRQALAALTIDRSVDVVAVVAGQPAKLLNEMRPEARAFIRLLPLDTRLPSSRAASRNYFPATIRAASYAQWLEADVPTLSVLSFLVTRADRAADPAGPVARFTESLCRNIGVLRRQGHPKWREVDVTLKLGTGWTYTKASVDDLVRCPDEHRETASSDAR